MNFLYDILAILISSYEDFHADFIDKKIKINIEKLTLFPWIACYCF